ncbi:hypothetical protein B0H16DRAFT_1538905 [Mycena metata]|uniref:VWFA domain-containing protein n=1 Tax=Mycena metata TaxID=1033252 RepID=A0AAD7J366_9AGAR|nr:hypothetical protein B0H16DRAFT_1568391 [Mycena metata]KAJ7756177.1 hypothetical protein B0H16DRAFT_1538905 [Mycena metata]
MDNKPAIFVSQASSHSEGGQWASSSNLTAEPAGSRRSFLRTIFSHHRSRSADARDNAPPTYYEALQVATPKRSLSTKMVSRGWMKEPMRKETLEDALEILRRYDTVILVDDSSSMSLPGSKKAVSRWDEAGQALAALAQVVQGYDADGIDIHFLNARKKDTLNMKSSTDVQALFNSVEPYGATPTGHRLENLLKPYLRKLERARIDDEGTPWHKITREAIKPVNFIVITDGEATDDPKTCIVDAGTRLKAMSNLSLTQLGIQFVQVGNDSKASKALKELDDGLTKAGNIRDIVDTTPYSKLSPVTADGLIKVLLGGINRRIDEEKNTKKKAWLPL